MVDLEWQNHQIPLLIIIYYFLSFVLLYLLLFKDILRPEVVYFFQKKIKTERQDF